MNHQTLVGSARTICHGIEEAADLEVLHQVFDEVAAAVASKLVVAVRSSLRVA